MNQSNEIQYFALRRYFIFRNSVKFLLLNVADLSQNKDKRAFNIRKIEERLWFPFVYIFPPSPFIAANHGNI